MRARLLLVNVGIVLLVAVGCTATSETSTSASNTSATATDDEGPGTTAAAGTPLAAGPCPVEPVPVVVSVDQWGDIVGQLGGECAEVTTVFASSSADPHDYEPSPGDIASFSGASLVVVNGVDYDPWAEKAADALDPKPVVVNGGEVVGVEEGDNPHIWYSPEYVQEISAAVTDELEALSPGAAAYFEERAAAWDEAMEPYRAEIAAVEAAAKGRTYGATESVFDYMAEAVGLEDRTPQGYQNAAANESDPAPGDVAQFQSALEDGSITVLIFNSQTEGSIPDQIRDTATRASVPVVNVTESMPPGVSSFVEWQVTQLRDLRNALG